MDTIFIALVRWGPEWDGQSIYRTKSRALFEQMKLVNDSYNDDGKYFSQFSDELKTELRAHYAQQKIDYPELTSEPLDEEMSIADAMEWLECFGEDYNNFPVILGGTTELTCSWNW